MKKLSLKISGKIGLGYGILTIAILINAAIVIRSIIFSSNLNNKISKVYEPSVFEFTQLQNMVGSSNMLIRSWVFVDKIAETPDKLQLANLHSKDYPQLIENLNIITDEWDDSTRVYYQNITTLISDSLFSMQKQIMSSLRKMDDYMEPETYFPAVTSVADDGAISKLTRQIQYKISYLIGYQNKEISKARAEMEKSFVTLKEYTIFTCLVLVLVSVIIGLITVRSLVRPINKIRKRILWMSKGSLPESNMKVRRDEIGEMAEALNQLVGGLKALSNFALEIGRGNYHSNFTPLSDDDVLGNALLHMRDDLHAASEEETKRKLEDQQRNWATAGIAKFSEILRQDNDKLDLLTFHVISSLVNYLEANQGGIFMINDLDAGEQTIDLVSCYAYNRQKHIQKRLKMGEGLVGRCIQEKETIYLTDIPNEYIKIKSGLGEANPRSLLLVPLAMNTDVFGVIEIASFNEVHKYQIEFVEKIAESIASTLKAVRINMRTSKLLEQSRVQAEELASQEEEMRQNMEELRATQEESSRKEKELQKTVDELKTKLDED